MKALIDIKTPAGKSLEGFPQIYVEAKSLDVVDVLGEAFLSCNNLSLHPGDTITITIQPD